MRFFFSSRRRHTRFDCDWSSDVCSSDLAGKTNDVMINVPSATTALPIFDRELSLSANSIARDAGMLAYISVNGAALPTGGGSNKSEEHTSEIPSQAKILCALLL